MRIRYTIKIQGMTVNEHRNKIEAAIKNSMRLKSIKTSLKNGECVIRTSYIADEYAVRECINALGFHVVSLKREPYIEKSVFNAWKR